jgi:dolichyl-phosphate-mannose-protein mannosyltransferase
MLVGLAGALSGFNGSYDFPSGQVYPDHVPFRAMRILLAMPGVAMVPLAWGTSLELGFSNYAKHIVTLMTLCGELESLFWIANTRFRRADACILLDMAWLVISRFILLDSMLLFFTFTTVYFLACFHNQQR